MRTYTNTATSTSDSTRAVLIATGLVLVAICAFVLVIFGQKPLLLNILYPAAVLLVGGWLYIAHPQAYLGFAFWVWFVTPFVRRIIDFQVGFYTPVSLTYLAPLMVTGLTLVTLFRYGARLKERFYLPFLLSLLGVAYGYVVGVVQVGWFSATYGLLEYLLPLMLGFHIIVLWREYQAHARVVRTTFVWALLIIGTYGVFQYILAPTWDMQWLMQSGMTSSMGRPEPYGFRVFGTLSATGPFAKFLMTGLLIAMSGKHVVNRLAMVPGFLSMALSLVRSAWGGWIVAIFYIAIRREGAQRLRLLIMVGVCVAVCIPLLVYGPAANRVQSRFDTISNLQEDGSLKARVGLYRQASQQVLTNPIGKGIGALGTAAKLSTGESVSFDSGILSIPTSLGWLGALLYLGGLLSLTSRVIRIQASDTDDFVVAAVGVVVAHLALMLFFDQLKGLSGIVVWVFLSLAVAGNAFYQNRSSSENASQWS